MKGKMDGPKENAWIKGKMDGAKEKWMDQKKNG